MRRFGVLVLLGLAACGGGAPTPTLDSFLNPDAAAWVDVATDVGPGDEARADAPDGVADTLPDAADPTPGDGSGEPACPGTCDDGNGCTTVATRVNTLEPLVKCSSRGTHGSNERISSSGRRSERAVGGAACARRKSMSSVRPPDSPKSALNC